MYFVVVSKRQGSRETVFSFVRYRETSQGKGEGRTYTHTTTKSAREPNEQREDSQHKPDTLSIWTLSTKDEGTNGEDYLLGTI